LLLARLSLAETLPLVCGLPAQQKR